MRMCVCLCVLVCVCVGSIMCVCVCVCVCVCLCVLVCVCVCLCVCMRALNSQCCIGIYFCSYCNHNHFTCMDVAGKIHLDSGAFKNAVW